MTAGSGRPTPLVRPGFRPDIQGLRAVAVLAVVLDHARAPLLGGGYVGVDVFFVISGFLITSHLLRSLQDDGRIRFASFYARRARRILPASFTVLALSIVGAWLVVPPLQREQVLRDAVATALYVPNYAFAARGTDYLADTSPSLFQHYWSLGVEEQFYLLWPLLLLLAFVLGRGSSWVVRGVLLAVVVLSFAACVWLTWRSQPWAFFSLWTRAWELGLGGMVAAVPLRLPGRVADVLGWAGLGAILVACVGFSSGTVFPGVAVALPVLGAAALIASGGSGSRRGPLLLLGTPPAQLVGRISYSLYLVHWPVLVLAQAAAGGSTPLGRRVALALALASVPLAWLLHRLVEVPAMRSTWLQRTDRRGLIGAGVGSAVLAGVAAASIAVTAVLPLDAGRPVGRSTPGAPPDGTSFVPSDLRPALASAADDVPTVFADGCEVGFAATEPHPCVEGDPSWPRIVLFGDSHAAQWYPALSAFAADARYRLEVETKSACPSYAVAIERNAVPYTACDTWRAAVLDRIANDPPALVVLANYSAPEFAQPKDESGQWARGMRDTIGRLAPSTKVAVLADTPDLRTSPIVCLSAHLTSATACARPRPFALGSPGRSAETDPANRPGATYIDLTDHLCTATSCPVIIGDLLVYRDSHHITATFAAALTQALGDRLRPVLASP